MQNGSSAVDSAIQIEREGDLAGPKVVVAVHVTDDGKRASLFSWLSDRCAGHPDAAFARGSEFMHSGAEVSKPVTFVLVSTDPAKQPTDLTALEAKCRERGLKLIHVGDGQEPVDLRALGHAQQRGVLLLAEQ